MDSCQGRLIKTFNHPTICLNTRPISSPTNKLGISFNQSSFWAPPVVSREFPDRYRFILSKGQRPNCLASVYWWTHQKRYNLTLWRMFEIQDVARANIYPSEYILLAGIFDRPPPGASCTLTVSLFLPPRSICAVCACTWSGRVKQ